MKSLAWSWLRKLDERDKKIYDKRKAKNEFEELIYKSWEWVNEDKNQIYVDKTLIESFLTNLTEYEDWLYEDGYDQPWEVYIGKIRDINDFYGKAIRR